MKVKFAFKPDEPNINKIIFKKEAIQQAVKNYLQKPERYGEIGQPEIGPGDDQKKCEEARAFIIQDITYNDKEFVGDIDILDNNNGKKLKEMLKEGAEEYRIVTLSRTEKGDWIENPDDIEITKMEFLNIGIVNKSQVF